MDGRVREHAELLVDWSARIERGDDVVVSVGEGAHDLAVAVAERLGEVGANPVWLYKSGEIEGRFGEVGTAYLDAHDGEFDEGPGHLRALYEHADVTLFLGGNWNVLERSGVSSGKHRAVSEAYGDIRQARYATDWVSTVHPTRSLAQQAGMSYGEYRDFVYDAVLRDWEALADEMARLTEILDDGSEVRIRKEGTDVSMSIEGRTAVNSAASVAYDSHNLPSGEVFTAPYDAEGTVRFDVPMTVRGRRVRNLELAFEDGEVVDYDAESGADAVGGILSTDEGARRLGELGVGMNRGIDRVTDNILFDEKMAETVHLAVGSAYGACLPEGESGNESAVHQDFITDTSEDAVLEVDGEVVQRNGVFRWEGGSRRRN
jgi:aminopeptidase